MPLETTSTVSHDGYVMVPWFTPPTRAYDLEMFMKRYSVLIPKSVAKQKRVSALAAIHGIPPDPMSAGQSPLLAETSSAL